MTTDTNHFNWLPDEVLEQIFLSIRRLPPLTENNHVRIPPNSLYFDYSIQQPFLKQTHADLFAVSLVCRRFQYILKSPLFWERKCRYDYVMQSTQNFPPEFTAYEKLYVHNPFHPSFNLIEENKWRKSRYSNSQIEFIPLGSHRLCDEFNRLSPCRVTSHTWGEFFQRNIQLLSKKYSWNDVSYLPMIKIVLLMFQFFLIAVSIISKLSQSSY